MALDKDDVVDSRDVIARIEELESEIDDNEDGWLSDGSTIDEGREELAALKAMAEEAESSPDWTHGESLIREDYFTQYIEQLIDDCYEMPEGLNSGEWPWRHFKMDFEAAAEEAKVDYMEVDWGGDTYLIRA